MLAGGATAWRDLPIPGRDLDGIHQAMEFLPWANRVQEGDDVLGADGEPPITAKGKKVVIIGGGDTGADCLGTVHRQGATEVHQFEIMPRPPDGRAESTPWPTYPLMFRVSAAHEEGGDRVFSVNTEEFIGRDGRVTGLRAHEVQMEGGKFVKVDGTDFELEADLVLLAMGFVGPERDGLLTDLGVEFTDRGNIARDDDYATTVSGRVRRRRRWPRPVADRVGHRRRPRGGGGGGQLPDGRHRASVADQADGCTPALMSRLREEHQR